MCAAPLSYVPAITIFWLGNITQHLETFNCWYQIWISLWNPYVNNAKWDIPSTLNWIELYRPLLISIVFIMWNCRNKSNIFLRQYQFILPMLFILKVIHKCAFAKRWITWTNTLLWKNHDNLVIKSSTINALISVCERYLRNGCLSYIIFFHSPG